VGDLSFTRVLLDYRRYLMPIKPYTIALRALHSARYGRDADDRRLFPTVLGLQYLVRGYPWGARLRCPSNGERECTSIDGLVANRMLVGNMELRFPVRGVLAREVNYGFLPLEGVIFADAALAWSSGGKFVAPGLTRIPLRSVGAAVRANAIGFILEVDAVRPLDRSHKGWLFSLNFRPGF
jgi:hypothetical protein